ncbi:thiopurine S-methyltransferase [Aestuariibacter sp. GS-14]|uniref:thiopurine S-methyltransferase n=1 Tax=Aestuariibacter sp. GS-14 TaxID=2590670 RepID=UPI001129008D|nr:thiopurine S-methyltransferase [Aestuariibacter sp. GS-14]TPV59153.1 thiopurine S-methyltransferase [Aestuariibacter sp. GS-14]
MQHAFWHDKWERGEIGFHQRDINSFLTRFADTAGLTDGKRVLVPLCGKSKDMTWLLQRGCEVVGIELNESAVQQYFKELGSVPEVTQIGDFTCYAATDITIFCGDVLSITQAMIGKIDAVYDRAALVALPADMRRPYVKTLLTTAPEARHLLITFEYDQALHSGPPFSVTEAELLELYGCAKMQPVLASEPLQGGLKGRVPAMESAWLIS